MVLTSAGAAGGAHLMSSGGPSVVEASADPEAGTDETLPTTSTSTSTTTTVADADEDAAEPTDADLAGLLSCSGDPVIVEEDPLEDWSTITLDPVRGIASDFEPADIIELDLNDVPGEIWIREIAVDDLTDLLTAADEADAALTLVSGYRTYEYQESLYEQGLEEDGHEANHTTAPPGHSEHQLGTTVDVLTPGMTELSADFGATPAGEWLSANASDYGFVVSYPADGQETTCYDYEPWHIRYVGRDVATEIVDSGLTPREWMLRQSSERD